MILSREHHSGARKSRFLSHVFYLIIRNPGHIVGGPLTCKAALISCKHDTYLIASPCLERVTNMILFCSTIQAVLYYGYIMS